MSKGEREMAVMMTKNTQLIEDPFPNLSFAKSHLWGMLDHWAWRRMQRLGFPSPWAAWTKGYNQAYAEMGLRARHEDQKSIAEKMGAT